MTDHIVPVVMILLCVAFAVMATFGMPRGEWAVAVYAGKADDAFQRAAAVTNEIADVYPRVNGALVRAANQNDKNNLRRSGAILLDPMGIPLCYNPQS